VIASPPLKLKALEERRAARLAEQDPPIGKEYAGHAAAAPAAAAERFGDQGVPEEQLHQQRHVAHELAYAPQAVRKNVGGYGIPTGAPSSVASTMPASDTLEGVRQPDEFMRNVPLLVQLFFWYVPDHRNAPRRRRRRLQALPGVFLSNRGILFPLPGSAPLLEGFNFSGGLAITPEFAALLAGLVTYTAAFIAEIVRAGVLSVSRGQFRGRLRAWPHARARDAPRGAAARPCASSWPPLTSQ